MILRVQNLMLAALLALATLLLGFGQNIPNPMSGGYQLFGNVEQQVISDNQLVKLGKFEPAPETASDYVNATNRTPIGSKAAEKVTWVDESAGMSPRARAYDDGAMGSRSNVETRKGQAPALTRTTADGKTVNVRFDGVDGDVLIDRKISVVTTSKAKNQVLRQSEALEC